MKNVITLGIIMTSSLMGFAQHESTVIGDGDSNGHSKEATHSTRFT